MISSRFITLDIDVTPFDDSAAIHEYARRYYEDGHQHESFNDAADQVASDLKDPSAAMRFKREVRNMRRNRAQ